MANAWVPVDSNAAFNDAVARATANLQARGVFSSAPPRPPVQGSSQQVVTPSAGNPSTLPGGPILGAGARYVLNKFPGAVGGAGAGMAAPSSLPLGTQASNVLSGYPANAVSSNLAPGSSVFSSTGQGAYGLADGTATAAQTMANPTGAFGLATEWGSGTMGTVGPVASALAALHGGYNTIKNFGRMSTRQGIMNGAETGAGIGGMIGGPAGAAVGGLIGAPVGAIASLFHSGKHKDQYQRDQGRAALQAGGVIDGGYNLQLADGSTFNIGVDGGARPEYGFSGGRRPYEINEENPLSQQASLWGISLAETMFPGNEKMMSDFSGYFANAAMSNAQSMEGVRANILGIAAKAGLTQDKWVENINQMAASGQMDPQRALVLGNAVNALFQGDAKNYDMRSVAEVKQQLAQMAVQPPGAQPPTSITTPQGAPPPQLPAPAPTATMAPKPFLPSEGQITHLPFVHGRDGPLAPQPWVDNAAKVLPKSTPEWLQGLRERLASGQLKYEPDGAVKTIPGIGTGPIYRAY